MPQYASKSLKSASKCLKMPQKWPGTRCWCPCTLPPPSGSSRSLLCSCSWSFWAAAAQTSCPHWAPCCCWLQWSLQGWAWSDRRVALCGSWRCGGLIILLIIIIIIINFLERLPDILSQGTFCPRLHLIVFFELTRDWLWHRVEYSLRHQQF